MNSPSSHVFVKAKIWNRYRRCVVLRINDNGTVDLRVMGGDLVSGMPGIWRGIRPEEIRKADRHLIETKEEADPLEGYRGPSAMTDGEREANVNEILEFEADNPETPAEFVNRLTDEMTASLQDPNKGRK